MRRASFLFRAFFAILSACLFLEGLFLVAGSDGLIFCGMSINAGRLHPGEVTQHSAKLYNLAPWSVTVDMVPTCGCTVVEGRPETVMPFHCVILPFQLTASREHHGRVRTAVEVVYDLNGRTKVRQINVDYEDYPLAGRPVPVFSRAGEGEHL
jgi:hypothetical protein